MSSISHFGAFLQLIDGPPGFYKVKIKLNQKYGSDSDDLKSENIIWEETKYFTRLDINGTHKFIKRSTFSSWNYVNNDDSLQIDLYISMPNVEDHELLSDHFVLPSELKSRSAKNTRGESLEVHVDNLIRMDKTIYSDSFYTEFQCWRLKIFKSGEFVSVFMELLTGACNSYWINVKLIREAKETADKALKRHEQKDKILSKCFKFNQTSFCQGWTEFIKIDELSPFIRNDAFLDFKFDAGLSNKDQDETLRVAELKYIRNIL